MTTPYVVLRLPDGSPHEVYPGCVIGRLASSPISLDHPEVSEAHALLSHRGDGLQLISLSPRPLKVEGRRAATSVRLQPGQRIELATECWVEVDEVHLPSHLLSLRVRPSDSDGDWTDLGPLLGHEFYSVEVRPHPALHRGSRPGAFARIVSNAEGHAVLTADGVQLVSPDLSFSADGWTLGAVERPISLVPATHASAPPGQPCLLTRKGDEVLVTPMSGEPFWLRDKPGRILATLMASRKPLGRLHLASTICGGNMALFQVDLSHLKKKLRERGVDENLVVDCDNEGRPVSMKRLLWVASRYREGNGPLHRLAHDKGPRTVWWDGVPLVPVSVTVDALDIASMLAFTPQGQVVILAEATQPWPPDQLLRLLPLASACLADPEATLAAAWDQRLSGHDGTFASAWRAAQTGERRPPVILLCNAELPEASAQLVGWLRGPSREVVRVEGGYEAGGLRVGTVGG